MTQIHVDRKRLNKQIVTVPSEMKELSIASHLANMVDEAIESAPDVYRFVDGATSIWNCINYGTG